jgi:hypothetical protein
MSPFEKGHKNYNLGKNKSEEEKIEVPEQFNTAPVIENKPEEVIQPQENVLPQTFVIKTEVDAYINERLISQPKKFEDIKVRDNFDDSVANHILKLPKEIKKALDEKNMTPYWINKKKKAIDHALDTRGWTIFNRVLFPNIPKHNFTANGTVEIGDCILGFMPAKNAEILRRRPGLKSQEMIKNLPIEAYKNSKGDEKIGYYKPAYTAEPDGEIARREAGLFAQPDVANVNE